MSEEGVLQSLEAQNELTQLSKCLDPAFKLFGRTIPVHSASETSEKSSESNDSCEVENFSLEKSSSNSSFCLEEVSVKEMSSDDYKSSVCVQKCSEENVCSDDGRPSLGFEEKFQTETFNDEKTKFGIDKINLKKNLDGIKKIHEKKINDGKLAVYEEQYVKDEESLLKKKYLNDEKSTCVEGQKIKKKDLNDKKSSIGAETNGIKDGLEEINRNEDGVPKKPNKLLPCPRCESMDTKLYNLPQNFA